MAQQNTDTTPNKIGKHLGDLSPSKAVEAARDLRKRENIQQGRRR